MNASALPRPRLGLLQHHPAEGPGRIAHWAHSRGVVLDVVSAPSFFQQGPRGLLDRDWQALLLLGGPWHASAPPPWLAHEAQALAAWLKAGRPAFGICLGAQLMATVLGAEVYALDAPELGWTLVQMEGVSLPMLQWHEQAFRLPPGAQQRASGRGGLCQGFSQGEAQRAYQFHPEWDAETIRLLHAGFGPPMPLQLPPNSGDEARHAAVARWFQAELDDWLRSWS